MNDIEFLDRKLRSIRRVRSNGENKDEGRLVCNMVLNEHFTVQVKCDSLVELLEKCKFYEENKLNRTADADPERYDAVTLVGGDPLLAHKKEKCEGEFCCIHNPSDHHMKDWPQLWRDDRKMMERLCPHGTGHPDPDDPTENRIHGCDGCCSTLNEEEKKAVRRERAKGLA
jgi:hypothetical protein